MAGQAADDGSGVHLEEAHDASNPQHGQHHMLADAGHEVLREMGIVKHSIYHCILFFHHWFAGTHFDHHGKIDGEVDHEHLDEYLHARGLVSHRSTAAKGDHGAIAKRRATMKQKVEQNYEIKRRASSKTRASSTSTDNEDVNAAVALLGVSPQDSPAEINAAYFDKARGAGKSKKEKLDKAYNTIMDYRQELLDSGQLEDNVEEKARGNESQVIAEMQGKTATDLLFHNPRFPRFIVIQCFVCTVLWFANCIHKASMPENEFTFTIKGGLDSFVGKEGSTDLRWAGPLCEDYSKQVWRWITYQWTHVHFSHLFTNVFNSILLGIPLEGFHGTRATIIIFNAGVFGGAMLYYCWEAHVVVVGMSGGVCSLVGMRLGSVVMNWNNSKYKWTTIFLLFFLTAMDSIVNTFIVKGSKTSHTVHAGGGFCGFLSAIVFGRHLYFHQREKVFYVLAILSAILMIGTCLTWLYTNDGPLTMREKFMENIDTGYCWYRQVLNYNVQRAWICVKCSTEECVRSWETNTACPGTCIASVDYEQCDQHGWYDGPPN